MPTLSGRPDSGVAFIGQAYRCLTLFAARHGR
jgi:hypothetical protein